MKWLQRRKEGSPIRELARDADLTEALAAPEAVLYKHSPACWIGMIAHRQIRRFVQRHPEIPVYIVDVLAQRRLSDTISKRLQVRHESPQVIVVAGGKMIWSASHGQVRAESLAEAVGARNPE